MTLVVQREAQGLVEVLLVRIRLLATPHRLLVEAHQLLMALHGFLGRSRRLLPLRVPRRFVTMRPRFRTPSSLLRLIAEQSGASLDGGDRGAGDVRHCLRLVGHASNELPHIVNALRDAAHRVAHSRRGVGERLRGRPRVAPHGVGQRAHVLRGGGCAREQWIHFRGEATELFLHRLLRFPHAEENDGEQNHHDQRDNLREPRCHEDGLLEACPIRRHLPNQQRVGGDKKKRRHIRSFRRGAGKCKGARRNRIPETGYES